MIKGLSDNVRMPRLGKIRLGGKKINANNREYPFASDHFIVTDELKAQLGEKPTVLDIMFPCEDDDQFASQYYRMYSQTLGLICRGNGETCSRKVDTATGDFASKDSQGMEWREGHCEGRECHMYKAKKCKETMFLQFLLPKQNGLGVWQLDTGSRISMEAVNSMLRMLRLMCGRVSMIPLKLVLEPKEVAPDGKKKTVMVLNLKSEMTIEERSRILATPVSQVMLPAPIPPPDDATQPDCVVHTIEAYAEEPPDDDMPSAATVPENVPMAVSEIEAMWGSDMHPAADNQDFVDFVSEGATKLGWSLNTLKIWINEKRSYLCLSKPVSGTSTLALVCDFTPKQQEIVCKLLNEMLDARGR